MLRDCRLIAATLLLLRASAILAAEPTPTGNPSQSAEPPPADVLARMRPYQGQSVVRAGADAARIAGKVLCGYQGWFTAPGDASGRGWSHYDRGGRFEPGHCAIALWPDVTEL